MDKKQLKKLWTDVAKGKVSKEEAEKRISEPEEKDTKKSKSNKKLTKSKKEDK